MEVQKALHRLFVPTTPRQDAIAIHPPERVIRFIEQPFHLRLEKETVRAVLDEIARQDGAMSWVVEYADAGGGYRGLRLSFVGFDGWVLTDGSNGL